MGNIRTLDLLSTHSMPFIECLEHYGIESLEPYCDDSEYLVSQYMNSLSNAINIKGINSLTYENAVLVDLAEEGEASVFGIKADINIDKLPTLMQLIDANHGFDIQTELSNRIKELAGLTNVGGELFNAGNLNHDMANWDDLWIVTYIWLLASIGFGEYKHPTKEISAMEQVWMGAVHA